MESFINIMPCLDIRAGRVVKGIQFDDLIDAGDPVTKAVGYEADGADELDMVINVGWLLAGEDDLVRRDIEAVVAYVSSMP